MAKPLTDEEFDQKLKEIDDIQKMTPDEAYRKSVAELGRAPGITDEMHAAASMPQAQLDAMKAKVAPTAKPTPTATATPTPTQQPQPQTVVGKDGKGRTTFGGYVRVVDQKTGATTWEDLKGNAVEAPKSVQMMDVMNSGLRPKGDLSWDDAIKQQSFERIGKANAYAKNAIDANRKARDERIYRRNKQTAMTGDQIGAAMADLQENLKVAQTRGAGGGELSDGSDGGRIYKAKDGNYYVRGIVRSEALDLFNSEAGKFGSRDKAERIVASQRVDEHGNKIGDPTFHVLYRKNGLVNDKGDGVYAKSLTLGQAVNSVVNAQKALGMDEKDAQNYAVRQFGANPFNWKLEDSAPASVQAAQVRAASAKEVQELKNKGATDTQALKNQGAEAVQAAKGKSAEEVAKINGEYQKTVAEITQRAKSSAQTNGKITGSDIASLLKVASDPLASEDVRQSAIETASLLQDRLNGAAQGGGVEVTSQPAQGQEGKKVTIKGKEYDVGYRWTSADGSVWELQADGTKKLITPAKGK